MPAQPIKIAILAMGGEGGGVLADWIVDLGEYNGFLAQTTSVPGVAQPASAPSATVLRPAVSSCRRVSVIRSPLPRASATHASVNFE